MSLNMIDFNATNSSNLCTVNGSNGSFTRPSQQLTPANASSQFSNNTNLINLNSNELANSNNNNNNNNKPAGGQNQSLIFLSNPSNPTMLNANFNNPSNQNHSGGPNNTSTTSSDLIDEFWYSGINMNQSNAFQQQSSGENNGYQVGHHQPAAYQLEVNQQPSMLIMMPPPPAINHNIQGPSSSSSPSSSSNITLIQNGGIGSLKRSNSSPVSNKSPSKKNSPSKPKKTSKNSTDPGYNNVTKSPSHINISNQQPTGALTIAHLINNNSNNQSNSPSVSSTSASPLSNIALLMSPNAASSPGGGGVAGGLQINDPNAPKPPLTGYQHYFKLRQSELRSQDASLKFGDIVKIVGNEWSKNMDKEMKNKYITRGLEDKERYKNELKAYQQMNGETSPHIVSQQPQMISQQFQNKMAQTPTTNKFPKNLKINEMKLDNNNSTHINFPSPILNPHLSQSKVKDMIKPAPIDANATATSDIFGGKDYFNIDAYQLRIMERSLQSNNEIKFLRQKQHQLKLEVKKASQFVKSLKSDLERKQAGVFEMRKTNDELKSKMGFFKSFVQDAGQNNSNNYQIASQQMPSSSVTASSSSSSTNYSNSSIPQEQLNKNQIIYVANQPNYQQQNNNQQILFINSQGQHQADSFVNNHIQPVQQQGATFITVPNNQQFQYPNQQQYQQYNQPMQQHQQFQAQFNPAGNYAINSQNSSHLMSSNMTVGQIIVGVEESCMTSHPSHMHNLQQQNSHQNMQGFMQNVQFINPTALITPSSSATS